MDAALSDGSHTVRVESTDSANNKGYAEVTFQEARPEFIPLVCFHRDMLS
jgi:hypothetical protein